MQFLFIPFLYLLDRCRQINPYRGENRFKVFFAVCVCVCEKAIRFSFIWCKKFCTTQQLCKFCVSYTESIELCASCCRNVTLTLSLSLFFLLTTYMLLVFYLMILLNNTNLHTSKLIHATSWYIAMVVAINAKNYHSFIIFNLLLLRACTHFVNKRLIFIFVAFLSCLPNNVCQQNDVILLACNSISIPFPLKKNHSKITNLFLIYLFITNLFTTLR